MKIKQLMVLLGLVMSATFAYTAEFTWDGGGTDDNWVTPGNWNPDGAPADDGTAVLTFSGNTRTGTSNDFAADTGFAGINLVNDNSAGKTSAFSLSGTRLTLGGNITTTGSSATIIDTIALDMILDADRTVTANSKHDLKITGDISETGGSQALTKTGGGALYLQGDNTYSGKTTISGGEVYFYSLKNIGEGASSLGAPTDITNGTIELQTYLRYQGAATISDRPIHLNGGVQIKNYGSGTLTLNGDITGPNRSLFIRGSKDITINGLISIGNASVGRTDTGKLTLNCPTNLFSGSLSISDGYIVTETISDSGAISAIGQGSHIYFGQRDWDTTGKLQFNGASGGSCNRGMTVRSKLGNYGGLIENTVAGQLLTMSGDVNDDGRMPPPFWLTGSGDGEMSGVIKGGIKVIKTGSGTWTLSGENATTGTVTVSDGTLLINGSTSFDSAVDVGAAGALGGTGTVHGAVSVAAGGTLVPGGNGIGTLTLDNGSSADLTLNGNTIECDISGVPGSSDLIAISGSLVLNGVSTIVPDFPAGPVPVGVYTLMTYAEQTGFGTMVVDPVYSNALVTVGETNVTLTVIDTSTVVWKGDGIANVWDTTTANWIPDYYADDNVVVFDNSGSAAPAVSITDAVAPFSVTVDADTNAYTIGGAAITGAGGLTKTGTNVLTLTGANTYSGLTSVDAGKLILDGSLSNSTVTVASGATLVQSAGGVIAGDAASINCLSSSILAGSNTYDGVTTVGIDGTPNIILTVRNNQALGSSLNGVTLYGGDSYTESRVRIDVEGIVIKDETLSFAGSGKRAGLQYYRGSGVGAWDGNLVMAGALCYLNSEFSGGTLVIGGSSEDTITGSGGSVSLRGGGTIIINSTINIESSGLQRDDPGTCLINSTGNTLDFLNILQGTFKLGVENALPSTTRLTIGKSGNTAHAKFDLNGKSQVIANLVDQHNTSVGGGTQKILSSTPATLIVSNMTANTFGLTGSAIEGEVSIVKLGDGTLTLTSTNTTAGSFIVSNGTLVVSATGSFGENSTNVVVAAGTLTLQSSVSIADTATLSIADGGAQVNLEPGVNESVAYMFWGETPKRAGTYGATGSGAANIDNAHFAGSGILTVLRDHSGTVILVR